MAAAGDKVTASGFNALFTRLEEVRKKQYARPDVTASNLSSAFTAPAVVGQKPVPNDVQKLKTYAKNLDDGVNTITSFFSSITVPTVGQLLQASTINLMETAVANIEKACVNCTNNRSDFRSNHGNDGNNSNDGNNGNFGNHGVTCFSNWGSNCSWF